MINCVYFVKDYLEFEKARLQSASNASDAISLQHAQASLFETFLWLHLGVELDYFDQRVAEHLLQTVYEPELFSALRVEQQRFAINTPEYESLPMERRYNDTFFRLAGLFPALQPLLTRCVDRQEVFSFFRARVKNINKLRPIFQCLYSTSRTMSEDASAQNFIAAVNFCNDSEWNRLTDEKISTEKLFTGIVDSPTISVQDGARIVPGFVRLLAYMSKFKSMHDDILAAASEGVVDRRDLGMIFDRIRMMQGWRTSVLSATANERITKLAATLDLQHNGFLVELGLKGSYFTTQFRELRSVWFRLMSAGA